MTGRTMRLALLAALLPVSPLAAEPGRRPADVERYLTRLTGCRHWTGEDAYDAARGREIAAAVKDLGCDALDADEARLRRRHGRSPAILKILDAARDAGG
ncbi:hypothetical protein AFCDBAGC_4511 [Methylobacterium cerastii]|uniref:Uncharacterized protein n=2 Tax=Methylobacterium TaxID=407 RepID=A0ABQ4QMY8_9HYPH|nr:MULTISPECIES: hypothetical protein [Methylobacterium]TXM81968.1 hypothetical protein FV219_27520 [Methylobacterium sp. WL122]TXN82429.1 hypothetical protein FV234_10280 [Methylobacterium sp. WL8]GJD46628.1 hypothetical protein AFCDBAGC_4511 [Methylobacterium cerastii]